MTNRDNRRFQKGSGVYNCIVCGKRTRETGDGESDVQMCALCYFKESWYNAVQDGDISPEQYEEMVAKKEQELGVK